MNYNKNQQGMTLIEVVVSILLIGIILFSFFTLLLQSNKATHKSNGIMDSTYMAQIEMENFYNASSNACNFKDVTLGYTLEPTEQNSYTTLPGIDKTYHFAPRKDDDYMVYLTIETFLKGTIYENAIFVHLDVIENKTNSKATMENVFELGGRKSSCDD